MKHLRGINGRTQCGKACDGGTLGIHGFRQAHGMTPNGVCLVCLNKSRRIRMK